MNDVVIAVRSASGRREVRLADYLPAEAADRAADEAMAWIKRLRHARVDGDTLRRRFTYRDDSLWWFAELYLHKQQVVAGIFRTIAALEHLLAREAPGAIEIVRPGVGTTTRLIATVAPQIAAAAGVGYEGQRMTGASSLRLAAMDARARALTAAALASRVRSRPVNVPAAAAAAVAFVHRAFWRRQAGDGSDEAYIGPVLTALERQLGAANVSYVTVGPASNFRARRWWHALRAADPGGPAQPIETFAPLTRLSDSRRLWRERHRMRRALCASDDVRALAEIRGCDCWPLIREELAGVALLQWPWSARAMDEAGAALDTLQPRVAVTYAEAGGWGRAIVLECRRRRIPSVGLQHGFIYRHWLNYLHEADEMQADGDDRGFPAPTSTVLFDDYAADHLARHGRFAADRLAVAGSPRLDALAAGAAALTAAEIDRARSLAGAPPGAALVLVTTKFSEARGVLGALVEAVESLPGVHLAIKTHPAETPEMYAAIAAGRARVRVLDAATPLAPLLRASAALVTVNSTVALDAAVLDVPALVIGLPNNLSPFVDAGVMAGAGGADAAGIARALRQILYDEEFRQSLSRARGAFLTRYRIDASGQAAERAADVIRRLAFADEGTV